MKVAVAGTGYVGLVTGVCLASIGHDVTCVDINELKINMMKKGISPIYEENLENLMKENKSRLTYTTDFKEAYKNAEVIFIGVGTPEREDGSANLDYVEKVINEIVSVVTHDITVVIKSTVPIGTNDKIEKKVNNKLKSKFKVNIVSNPEFLSQGTAVKDTLYASRIVIGVEDSTSEELMKKIYQPLTKEPYNVPLLIMDRKSAEMVKYASNNFLALKISFVNEIANLCDKTGANVEDVTKGMGYDTRIGNKFLNAGIGYGGSCFPKDTKALYWLSKELESELLTIQATIEVNKKQKTKMFYEFLNDNNSLIKNKNVAVLGAAFKAGTDDIREAPSIDNIKLLIDHGVNVTVYDPIALDNMKKVFGDKINYSSHLKETLKDKDAVLIMTEWPEVKKLTVDDYKSLMKKPVVYDGRNCYKINNMKSIKYKSIGR